MTYNVLGGTLSLNQCTGESLRMLQL